MRKFRFLYVVSHKLSRKTMYIFRKCKNISFWYHRFGINEGHVNITPIPQHLRKNFYSILTGSSEFMQRWCLFFEIRSGRKNRFLGNEISLNCFRCNTNFKLFLVQFFGEVIYIYCPWYLANDCEVATHVQMDTKRVIPKVYTM